MAAEQRTAYQATQAKTAFESHISTLANEHPVVMVLAAIALLAISAQVVIPVGPVPFTMQVFALAFIACTFPLDRAVESVGGYVAAGAFGAPVFAGLKGGAVALLGPTGGFIWGMLPGVAAACGLIAAAKLLPVVSERVEAKFAVLVAAGVVCTLIMYVCGCVQFSLLFGADMATTLAACVTPFVAADAAKVVLAAVVALGLRRK